MAESYNKSSGFAVILCVLWASAVQAFEALKTPEIFIYPLDRERMICYASDGIRTGTGICPHDFVRRQCG